jgi:cobalt-zinc-cadmium efflux system outer membrane protein
VRPIKKNGATQKTQLAEISIIMHKTIHTASRRAVGLVFLAASLFVAASGFAQITIPDSVLLSYIQESWKSHPDLQSMREMVIAESNRASMSRAWMNPELRGALMNIPESLDAHMDPMTMWQIGVMQEIPFPGKLSASGQANAARIQAASASLEDARYQMVSMIAMAYYELAAALATRQALERGRDLTQQIADAAALKIASSTGSQSDLLRARIELEQWNAKLVSNAASIETKRANLAYAVGRSDASSLRDPALPDSLPTEPIPALGFAPTAIDSTPEVRKAKYDSIAAESEVHRAKLDYWPNVTVGLTYGIRGYLRTMGTDPMTGESIAGRAKQDNMISVELTAPLPVFYRNNQQARVSELEAMTRSRSDDYNRAVLAKEQELRTIYAQWKERADRFRINQSVLLKTEDAWQATLNDYLSGVSPFMNLSEARMNVVMAQMESIMLRADSWGLFWRWHAALGTAIQSNQEQQ